MRTNCGNCESACTYRGNNTTHQMYMNEADETIRIVNAAYIV